MQIPSFPLHRRPERAVIAVGGADAASFLHGLITADVQALASGEAPYGALLQPQGKMLFDLFVFKAGERYLIDCSALQKSDLRTSRVKKSFHRLLYLFQVRHSRR